MVSTSGSGPGAPRIRIATSASNAVAAVDPPGAVVAAVTGPRSIPAVVSMGLTGGTAVDEAESVTGPVMTCAAGVGRQAAWRTPNQTRAAPAPTARRVRAAVLNRTIAELLRTAVASAVIVPEARPVDA